VHFSNIGLLIIDEEHRFGVRHKELLKKLRSQVDVLVLTATPIPRTLHMSLIGARDMSLIRTPPQHRLPIETEIAPFSSDLIKDAILREIDRGGQVYFVHNRIESIQAVRKMLERWLPQVRFVVAHGQMPEGQLERTMSDFLAAKYDVLISTMIIESGLDLPNVNTMIVNRADRFGLAQLYQLRGRIGRSTRQAYAYLLTPPKTAIPDQARKRLEAIRDCSYLGAGFQLAMHDLEIRGAGEIFGAKQSGFIHAVGFDLYQKMLEETVQELTQGGSPPSEQPGADAPSFEPKIEFPFDAFLPTNYVEHPEQRVELYRRLSAVPDQQALQKVTEEISDRYGSPPPEARHLFDYIALKIGCLKAGMAKLELREEYLLAEIYPKGDSDWRERLQTIIQSLDGWPIEFSGDDPPAIMLRWVASAPWPSKLEQARDLLARLA
jgi:transcription-repair coupling factor (superfamily II helicase)